MFEINDHVRLVRLKGLGEHCWMAEELNNTETSYKRAIWKPVTRLLSHHQAESWLNASNASESILRRFKAVSEATQ